MLALPRPVSLVPDAQKGEFERFHYTIMKAGIHPQDIERVCELALPNDLQTCRLMYERNRHLEGGRKDHSVRSLTLVYEGSECYPRVPEAEELLAILTSAAVLDRVAETTGTRRIFPHTVKINLMLRSAEGENPFRAREAHGLDLEDFIEPHRHAQFKHTAVLALKVPPPNDSFAGYHATLSDLGPWDWQTHAETRHHYLKPGDLLIERGTQWHAVRALPEARPGVPVIRLTAVYAFARVR